jgi:prepilin-type N-terminal cleavage/methylation domain-containing protein
MQTGTKQFGNRMSRGVSLLELMITIAIISILAGIAIPLYDGYIREGHLSTIRTTLNGLRTPLEDFRLDNGSYGPTGDLVGVNAITRPSLPSWPLATGPYDWNPSGDMSPYTYTVSVTGTNSYDVWGTFNANAAIWVRCDRRFANCCDPDSGTAVTNACP